MRVFVDTSAIIAMLDDSQNDHELAGTLWRELRRTDAELLTSNYVVVEAYALIQRRFGMLVAQSLASSTVPLMDVHWIDADLHRRATEAWLRANRRRLSFVDCVSFVLIRQVGVEYALAFDKHFETEGFPLPPLAARP